MIASLTILKVIPVNRQVETKQDFIARTVILERVKHVFSFLISVRRKTSQLSSASMHTVVWHARTKIYLVESCGICFRQDFQISFNGERYYEIQSNVDKFLVVKLESRYWNTYLCS